MDIKINSSETAIVKNILHDNLPNGSIVWVFGSRVTMNVKPYSDLDIAIQLDNQKKLSLETLSKLDLLFEESDLPYKVDICDYNNISVSFRQIIDNQKQLFCKLYT